MWVGLTGAGVPRDPLFSYETSLWQPRLVHAPVYRSSIETLRDDIVELIGVIDSDVAGAIAAGHRIDEVLTRKRTAIADGVMRL
ncbi:hypothetical protein [Frondihabitans australicus]|uniref:Uncharacterized protein n=1 Tax=Frondihabitans australicus TaxID=386892 RepID=A0A495IIQ3_9MICO|nr:hypothetical protein [Frondihabitans australicus]RKR75659.1 hypothetical protein C8E83_2807 [Frondihabitans australicus]